MATNTHNVLITIKQMGSRKVTRQLMGLTAALAGVGLAAVGMAKQVVRATDEMTNLGNKSRVSAKNQGEAARLWCFMTPWLLIAAGHAISQFEDRQFGWLLTLQTISAIITVGIVNGFSF